MAVLPEKVEPVEGAQVVLFPWTGAQTAISALNSTVSTLDTQLSQRSTMLPTIDDWEGTYRREFDSAYTRIDTQATGIKEALGKLAGRIVTAAESANSDQSACNAYAIDPENNPSPAERYRWEHGI